MVITLRGAINANYNTWGGVLYDGIKLKESRRYDITDIVDRVGGGDSFMGALIYGLLSFEGDDQRHLILPLLPHVSSIPSKAITIRFLKKKF